VLQTEKGRITTLDFRRARLGGACNWMLPSGIQAVEEFGYCLANVTIITRSVSEESNLVPCSRFGILNRQPSRPTEAGRSGDTNDFSICGYDVDNVILFRLQVLAKRMVHKMYSKLFVAFLLSNVVQSGNAQNNSQNIETVRKNAEYQTQGTHNSLPVFLEAAKNRLTFPCSWLSGNYGDYPAWQTIARETLVESFLAAPPRADYQPVVIAKEDRGSYVANKIVLNISGDSRVLGYLLIPKGKGPFPTVLLLHDHGARFDIGKEKVIRPFEETPERIASATEWVGSAYGGRFIGDELAKRGYLCFATDALNWSDRGGGGYQGQQAIASNLFNLGMSFAGLIAYEDLYAAEFLAQHSKVDRHRIAAMGLSMGAFRTWRLAALSDHISAGVAVGWMATIQGLMTPGNNITGGDSAYSMLHPGLCNSLDYPDVASIACPKPMLFYNGLQDGLFPVESVKAAYKKMETVWSSQNADELLETKLWDVPHLFNQEMQESAFEWLDVQMKK